MPHRPKQIKFFPIAVVIFGAFLATAIFSDLVSAAGPEFNIFPIAYTGAQNTDYPLLDARNLTTGGAFSMNQSDHDDGVTVNPGDTVELVIYYHNGAADADENTAHNVRVRAFLPGGSSQNHIISATLTADNASSINSSSEGGDALIKINTNAQTLEYVAGSTTWYPNRAASSQVLADGIVSGGVSLGDIRGCWNYSGYVKFRVRAGTGQSQTGSLQISKTVSNVTSGSAYVDQVDANPSDIVRFKLITTASGADVQQAVVRDIVPQGLVYRSETTKVGGVSVSDSRGLVGGGYEYGTLTRDQILEITFEAQVASASYFNNTTQTITNTANARGTNVSTVQDTADVRVLGQTQGTSFTQSKSAYNQTQGGNAQSLMANPGDIINYTLTYTNTGGTNMSSVAIEDDIGDVLKLADLINYGDGTLSGNVLRFSSLSIPAGVSITKTFQVRVRDVSTSETDLTMTNFYGNQVSIQVRAPTVKGAYIPPKTGPAENVVAVIALLFTAGIWAFKKIPVLKSRILGK